MKAFLKIISLWLFCIFLRIKRWKGVNILVLFRWHQKSLKLYYQLNQNLRLLACMLSVLNLEEIILMGWLKIRTVALIQLAILWVASGMLTSSIIVDFAPSTRKSQTELKILKWISCPRLQCIPRHFFHCSKIFRNYSAARSSLTRYLPFGITVLYLSDSSKLYSNYKTFLI